MSAPTVSATPARSKMDTKTITSIAMLTGISVIIAWMSKLMPPVMFLDFDFKHVVVCVGGPSPPPSSPLWWPWWRCSPSATPAPSALS